MRTFQISLSSWVIYIATLLFIIFGGIWLGLALLPTKGNPPVAIALTVIVIGGAFYLTRFTARAKTEWTITEDDIQIRWLSQFIFHNRQDLTVRWSDIQEYKYRPDKNFDLLKLKLVDGTVIRFWHNTSTTNDDFLSLINDFEGQVQRFNNRQSGETNDIKRVKTIFETNLGLALAIVTGILMVALPVVIAFLPHKSKLNWTGLVAAYAGGLFFIFQVVAYRRRNS